MGPAGDNPGKCVLACMSLFFKLSALNEKHCFCLDGGVPLEDDFSEGDDVLTVLDATQYLPKADGKSNLAGLTTVHFGLGQVYLMNKMVSVFLEGDKSIKNET